MYNDITNMWSEDTDLNVVKTWLVGGTDGLTYSITDRFIPRIEVDEGKYVYDYCGIEPEIDEIIGYKHDYKVDDPQLQEVAQKIVDGMNAFVEKVNANPGRYFQKTGVEIDRQETCAKCLHRSACEKNKPDFDMSGFCDRFNRQG